MYEVISYYKFQKIENPEEFCAENRMECDRLGLKGRVYVAEEGINGTLSGAHENISQYERFLHSAEGFEDVIFKSHDCEEIAFYDLRVKTRPEIVALKEKIHHDPNTQGGRFLSPHEWREVLESKEDYILIDTRNNYESEIGHFEGALKPDVKNFYDFPDWLKNQSFDKNTKVLMYCTGGIRCEKFSVYMKEKGFKDVNQLHGGILKYAEDENGAHFKGKCFVFDDRLVVPVDTSQTEPISRCKITGISCDSYINCANMDCNKLFICSEQGAVQMEGCCSEKCRRSTRKRPFDLETLYVPFRREYQYSEEDDEEYKILKLDAGKDAYR